MSGRHKDGAVVGVKCDQVVCRVGVVTLTGNSSDDRTSNDARGRGATRRASIGRDGWGT